MIYWLVIVVLCRTPFLQIAVDTLFDLFPPIFILQRKSATILQVTYAKMFRQLRYFLQQPVSFLKPRTIITKTSIFKNNVFFRFSPGGADQRPLFEQQQQQQHKQQQRHEQQQFESFAWWTPGGVDPWDESGQLVVPPSWSHSELYRYLILHAYVKHIIYIVFILSFFY